MEVVYEQLNSYLDDSRVAKVKRVLGEAVALALGDHAAEVLADDLLPPIVEIEELARRVTGAVLPSVPVTATLSGTTIRLDFHEPSLRAVLAKRALLRLLP